MTALPAVGTELFTRTMPPVNRGMLALYAGGSNDHTPVHYDIDSARAFGFDDVFAQGMFVMALLGRCLSDHAGPERIRSFRARFVARTLLGDSLTCRAVVENHVAERDVLLTLTFTSQSGEVKIRGSAVMTM